MNVISTTTYHGPLFTDKANIIKRKITMFTSPRHILSGIALLLAVVSFVWPLPWQVPTILLSIAVFLP